MASSLSDNGSSSTQKEVVKGLKIDSRLIQTAALNSSAIQNELKGLGVSVYNQLEFEAGVLKQIDDEVQRRTSEQDKKFLLTKHSTIKGELNAVRVELNDISKRISGLLSLPMASVASRLRELRAAQEQKTKLMNDLKANELAVLKKLANRDEPNAASGDTLRQARAGGTETEIERLIRMGHLTPFGTRLDEFSGTSSSKLPLEQDMDADAGRLSDKLGILGAVTSATVNEGNCSSSTASLMLGKKEPKIRLSSDSFDGLFTDDLAKGAISGKRIHRLAKIPKNINKEGSVQLPSTSLQNSDTLEPIDEIPLRDQDDWIPSLAELMEFSSSSESEYLTDDDMGKMKEKKKIRELSSEGDLSSDDVGTKTRKRGKGKMKGRKKKLTAKYSDDGDEDAYRWRMQLYQKNKSEFASSKSPDMELNGGLTIPGSIWHRLYRYQQTGVKWLWELHRQQAGGIVGDDMGLGKTIQIIAFLTGLKVSSLRSHVTRKMGLGPVLIVCPATVLHQWVSEFHSWWPPFRVAVLHSTGTYCGSKRHLVDHIVREDGVLVTTYSGIRLDQDLLFQHKWDYVVLDEGHKIRNPNAEITLACKQVMTSHRLILSGSPMQNNLRELWSLFDFVFPGKLGTLPVFMEQFSLPITLGGYSNATEVQVQTAYKCACILRDTINPYMLRRLKSDVSLQLPDMNEQVLFCRLTDYQYELYRDYIQGPAVVAMLNYGKKVFSGIITLRKLCNHPDLVTNDFSKQVAFKGKGASLSKAEASEEEEGCFDTIAVTSKNMRGSKKNEIENGDEGVTFMNENEDSFGHWRRSGKMNVMDALLNMWKKQNHRVLLFSQSRIMLTILERFIKGRGYSYRRMDGTTPISTRQPLVNEFNENNSIFVFLLTTRVGGLGVNLTGADRVVLYDPDWNPSTDTQARERAWRIGQTRQVTIYRLITSGTIEEKIYHRQIFKQFLTNRVLKDPRQRRFFKSNSLLDLFTLDSSAVEGNTETSAIFAGTESEILPHSLASHSRRTSSRKRKREERSGKGKGKLRSGRLEETCDGEASDGEASGSGFFAGSRSPIVCNDTEQLSDGVQVRVGRLDGKKKKRMKKRRKKRDGPTEIEGEAITGVSHACIYNPGWKDEEENSKQDDFILQKLFKKTGVHSALQHDAIMNSTDPDYVLVEAEASKVSKSASRALKESRHMCLQDGARCGRPTWTGQHGRAGAPTLSSIPRFGIRLGANLKSKLHATPISALQQKHFSGNSAGGTVIGESGDHTTLGSVNTSSNILLAKMRQRNTHSMPGRGEGGVGGASNTHDLAHFELLVEVRDFIALRGKVNGQATTGEILEQFAKKLPFSDAALFKAMLYEICDFTRYHGDGLWILKQGFR